MVELSRVMKVFCVWIGVLGYKSMRVYQSSPNGHTFGIFALHVNFTSIKTICSFLKRACTVEGKRGYESQLSNPMSVTHISHQVMEMIRTRISWWLWGKLKTMDPWKGLSTVPGLTCAFPNQLGLKDLIPFSSLNSASETSPPGFAVNFSLAQHSVSSPHIWIVVTFLVLSPLSWVSVWSPLRLQVLWAKSYLYFL